MKIYKVSVEYKATYMKDVYIHAPSLKTAKQIFKQDKANDCLTDGQHDFSGDYDEHQHDVPTLKSIKLKRKE